MNKRYANELESDFKKGTNKIKKFRRELLKTNSPEEQARIIKQIDSIAKEMEKNQKHAVRALKSNLKEKKSKKRR